MVGKVEINVIIVVLVFEGGGVVDIQRWANDGA